MPMDHRSDKHGPGLDDALEAEVAGELRAGHSTHSQEWREPEPEGEDQRSTYPRGGPEPGVGEDLDPADVELRSELARFLGRHAFPTDRDGLERSLDAGHAPDRLLSAARELPADRRFA